MISLSNEQALQILGDRRHRELAFLFYDDYGVFLGCETAYISWATLRGTHSLSLSVDPTYTLVYGFMNFVVSGYVTEPDGTPIDGVDVVAYKQNLRSESSLGTATTDSDGRFLIRYLGASSEHLDRASFSIRVEAEDAPDASVHICNPPPDQTVRLVPDNAAYRGRSDFELDTDALSPLLDTATFDELTVDDLKFLTCRTEHRSSRIATLARAHVLADRYTLPAAAFAALSHVGIRLSTLAITALNGEQIEAAIDRAVADNAVPASLLADKATIVAALAAARVDRIVPATDPTSTPLGAILVAGGLPSGLPRQFAEAYAANTDSIEEFWGALRTSVTFGDHVDRIQFSLQTGALTGGHAPLVKLLDQMRTDEEFATAPELAQYEESDWIGFMAEIVDGTAVSTPPGFVGADLTERKANYAAAITRMIADLYPSAHLAYRLPDGSVTADIAQFVIDNPRFSFEGTNITEFLPTANGYPALPEDQETLRKDLLKVQRVFAISPRYGRTAAAVNLLDEGVGSATQIRAMGRAAFAARFATSMDAQTRTRVYEKAEQVASTVLNSWLSMRPEMHFPSLRVLPSPTSENSEIQAILDSRDYCACPPCESVLGPAAYYLDVLQFLFRRFPDSPGFVILANLRPDLIYVDFSCKNSDTPLPTIDLINEVLEFKAFEPLGVDGSPVVDRQTTWDPDDLLAYPEHIELGVYEKLALPEVACFPLGLPFDLAFEETRAYLEILGTSRVEIQDQLEWFPDLADSEPERVNERLGLSSGQASIIRILEGTPELKQLWGFSETNWVELLNTVDVFLQRTGLDFDGLKELLKTKDLLGYTELKLARPCTLVGAKLVWDEDDEEYGLDAARIRMLQAFLRIRNAVGWTTPELDAVSRALDTTFNSAGFDGLSRFLRLRRRFPRLPLGEVLSWIAPLDRMKYHEGDQSYYEQVVRPAIIDPAFITLNGSHDLDDFRGELLGILQIDEASFEAALEATDLTVASDLDLPNLSKLYRVASLARAVDLPVVDLLALTKYKSTLTDVFAGGSVANVRDLIDVAQAIKVAGFTVPEFDWIFRGDHAEQFGGDNISAMRVLISLLVALQQVDKDRQQSLPPEEATLFQKVERLLAGPLPAEKVAEAMAFIRKETDPAPDYDGVRKSLLFFLTDGSPAAAEFDTAFGSASSAEERAEIILDELPAWLRQQALERVAIQQLAAAFALDVAATETLLRYFPSGGVALDAFTNDAFFATESFDPDVDAPLVQEPAFSRDFLGRPAITPVLGIYKKLRRIALLAAKFRLDPGLLRWLLTQPVDNTTPLPDLVHLQTQSAHAAYNGWLWLGRAVRVRDRLFPDNDTFTQFLTSVFVPSEDFDKGDVLVLLAQATGWGSMLTIFETTNPVVQLDLKRLSAVEAFAAVFRHADRFGVRPSTVLSWAKGPLTAATAAQIRNAARSKLGGNGWTAIAQPVRDKLRMKQRDALADYLVHKLGLKTREDLFGILYTDVDLACCNRTTRLLFTTGAVQLFMQRAFMGLQPGVNLTDEDAAEWAWTKRYRVWEANRKVFLYPENWVLPELRDDKTPLFKKLEDDLGQGELTEESVEKAYIRYLEGLRDIAHLQPSGMYHETETQGTQVDRMHVFAHSHAQPSKLFYRRRNTDAHWTAWEELPFQVEHGGVLPLMINRRLRLIWPNVQIKSPQPSSFDTTSSSTPKLAEEAEVSLNWSELLNDGWSGTVTSDERYTLHAKYVTKVDREDIQLVSTSKNGETLIRVNSSSLEYMSGIAHLATFRYNPCHDQFFAEAGSNDEVRHYVVRDGDGSYWHYQGVKTSDLELWTYLLYEHDYDTKLPIVGSPRGTTYLLFPRQTVEHDVTRPFVFADEHVALYMRPDDGLGTNEGSPDSQTVEYIDKQGLIPYLGLAGITTAYLEPPADNALNEKLLVDTPVAASIWTPYLWKSGYEAIMFYHPYACLFVERVRRYGVGGLLDPLVAAQIGDNTLLYQAVDEPLTPGYLVPDALPYGEPNQTIDFSSTAAYGVYNWEIFFHIPMLIADRLMAERRFADAQRWLGYIFNPLRKPTELDDDKVHFWGFKPFREAHATLSIEWLLGVLQYKGSDPAMNKKKLEMIAQIEHSRTNPFRPHDLARARPTAYMRTVVMKYLDNLIAWGDDLFRQDTRESTQEAAQLYILALQILGPRPRKVDGDSRPDKNWTEAVATIDEFSNFLVELENDVAIDFPIKDKTSKPNLKAQVDYQANFSEKKFAFVESPEAQSLASDGAQNLHYQPMSLGGILSNGPDDGAVKTRLYFCIPPNDRLLAYWDTIADRLFKLRNCLNIEGVRRDLALYDPPIDPALLVKAAAQGIDIGTAVSNLYAPLPHYRFLPHLAIAKEFVGQLSGLGAAFLQAVEKRDAEELAALRGTHELDLLKLMHRIKEQAIREAEQNIEAARRSRAVAVLRETYYSNQSAEFMNRLEQAEVELSLAASEKERNAALYHMIASHINSVVPGISVGFSGPLPTISLSTGGGPFAWPFQAMGDRASMIAQAKRGEAGRTATKASYTRRREEWQHQESLATADIRQIDAQITAGEIRKQMAEFELANLDRQIEQSAEALEFMHTKFTNAELYSWMSGELGKFYNLAYQVALDLARRAERCYRHELAVEGSAPDFVQFGHWDNRRQGLLAGERLTHDIRRMEAAYYENNRREYELTKRVSLASIDPVALVALRKMGACHFNLSWVLFALDHPSHYMRRIKLVSVAIPAVTGPYTSVGVTLTHETGSLRATATTEPEQVQGTAQAVAISVNQDDTGLFEPNLRDERYLPFEGRPLEDSKWRLELPPLLRQFDYETISDVILTIRYTAREGGGSLAEQIHEELTTSLQGMTRLEEPTLDGQVQQFSARAEFPEAWRTFVAAGDSGEAVLALDLGEQRFPHPVPALGIRKIVGVAFFVRWAAHDSVVPTGDVFEASVLKREDITIDEFDFGPFQGGIPAAGKKYNYVWLGTPELGASKDPGEWSLTVPGWAGGSAPEDIIIAVAYKVTEP